jgi:hypothetical protein
MTAGLHDAAKPATNFGAPMGEAKKLLIFQLLATIVPRPGVEPGLEVPETSVMSFSLPGLTDEQLIVAASRWFENLTDVAAKSLVRRRQTDCGDQENKRTSTLSRGRHSPQPGLRATFRRGGVRLQGVSRRECRPSADVTGRCSQ